MRRQNFSTEVFSIWLLLVNRFRFAEKGALGRGDFVGLVEPHRLFPEDHQAVLDEPLNVEGTGQYRERPIVPLDPQ
jgi:hypothetical protein